MKSDIVSRKLLAGRRKNHTAHPTPTRYRNPAELRQQSIERVGLAFVAVLPLSGIASTKSIESDPNDPNDYGAALAAGWD